MTPKQHQVLTLLKAGKSNAEICEKLLINAPNLHSTLYQMRKRGYLTPEAIRPKPLPPVTPTQKRILTLYAGQKTIPEIAKLLKITCQTVQNQAAQGFKRLGMTRSGVDRMPLLAAWLASQATPQTPNRSDLPSSNQLGNHGRHPETIPPITMDDPFFN